MPGILVVEDDENLNRGITFSLKKSGYEVFSAESVKKAKRIASDNNVDVTICDVNLPDGNGLEFVRWMRCNYNTYIICLTALDQEMDQVMGYEAGADDYLTKPFHLDELSARIRNLTLRKFTQNDIVLKCSNLSFNTKTRKADVNDEELSLTRKETGILEYLMLNQGRPVSQEELIEHVWDSSVDNFSNSIRVHISALRKKLRAALGYDPIRNRIGEGYVMEEEKV